MASKQPSQPRKVLFFVYGFFALLAAYAFASWAIDSGRIFPHIGAVLAVIYSIYFLKEALKSLFLYDKTGKAKRARSAH
jgi:uncharacterized membrane protein